MATCLGSREIIVNSSSEALSSSACTSAAAFAFGDVLWLPLLSATVGIDIFHFPPVTSPITPVSVLCAAVLSITFAKLPCVAFAGVFCRIDKMPNCASFWFINTD